MAPLNRTRLERLFEAFQAIVSLTFFAVVGILVMIKDDLATSTKIIGGGFSFFVVLLISFILTKSFSITKVLWFIIISILLASIFGWIVL